MKEGNTMRKKISVVLVIALTASMVMLGGSAQALTHAAAQKVDLHLVKAGTLTVGMSLSFKPEMYLDANGKPAGYDVAMVTALAKSLGLKLAIKNLDWAGLIPGLMARKFDMISAGHTATPERAKSITFTSDYVPYTTVVAAKTGTTLAATIAGWNVAGTKITALEGSTAAGLVKSTFPNATLVGFPEQSAAFLEVASGRANGIVVEEYLAADFIKSNPGQIAVVKMAKPIDVGFGAWGVQLGNFSLQKKLNEFICTNYTSGSMGKMFKKEMGFDLAVMPKACP